MGMKGYKGFRKGLICKDKQYAENTIFEESEANICVNGMHFCKNPMDVLDYYPLIDNNGEMCEFSEVEAMDETLTNDEKKYCTKKLKIGARLSLVEFIKASFDVTYRQIKEEVDNVSEKENVVDNATLAGGNNAKLAGGDNATLAGGYRAKLAGGDGATLAGGYNAKLAGGEWAKLAGGEHSIMVSENGGKAKGGIGSLIVMVERNGKGEIVNYKAIQIDGDTYKEDTWYRLEDGEIKEVE
nr:MAG TPA: hypothetical protein [Caudoviricetes sp.]